MTEIKKGDLVRAGFRTGRVVRIDGRNAIVQFERNEAFGDGAYPHRVPIVQCRKVEDLDDTGDGGRRFPICRSASGATCGNAPKEYTSHGPAVMGSIAQALSGLMARIDRVLGIDAHLDRHIEAARDQAEFERACHDAMEITRDGLAVPTAGDIDRMIAECESHNARVARKRPQ